jgi:hypothetical protein
MAVAADQGAVVLANDLDFGTILAAGGHSGPSVIQVRAVDLRPEVLGDLLLAAITRVAEELRDGALVTIDPGRTRVRVLPSTPPSHRGSRTCHVAENVAIRRLSPTFVGVRARAYVLLTCDDVPRRTPLNGLPRPGGQGVAGSDPVSPTVN